MNILPQTGTVLGSVLWRLGQPWLRGERRHKQASPLVGTWIGQGGLQHSIHHSEAGADTLAHFTVKFSSKPHNSEGDEWQQASPHRIGRAAGPALSPWPC